MVPRFVSNVACLGMNEKGQGNSSSFRLSDNLTYGLPLRQLAFQFFNHGPFPLPHGLHGEAAAFLQQRHLLEPRHTAQLGERDGPRERPHRLHIHHVPRRLVGIAPGIEVFLPGIERREVGIAVAHDLADAHDGVGFGARVVEQHEVALSELIAQHVARLVVPHAIPVGRPRGRVPQVIPGKTVRFGFYQPVLPWSGHTREEGQMSESMQAAHRGVRAMQMRRPCSMNRCDSGVHCSTGNSGMRSRSIFTGSVAVVRPSRPETRATCVSTTIPSLTSNALPRTTLAVLRPTPGSCVSSCMVHGTCPPCSSTSARAMPTRCRALLWKKLHVSMSCSTSETVAPASSAADGNRAKSAGVTMFTRTSVHWALSMVATSSSYGFWWCRAVRGSGYAAASRWKISAAYSRVGFLRRLDVRCAAVPGACFPLRVRLRLRGGRSRMRCRARLAVLHPVNNNPSDALVRRFGLERFRMPVHVLERAQHERFELAHGGNCQVSHAFATRDGVGERGRSLPPRRATPVGRRARIERGDVRHERDARSLLAEAQHEENAQLS